MPEDFIAELFGRSNYLAPFVLLLLCGLGLPIPEEVTLIGTGLLLYEGEVRFLPIVVVCGTAILIGDSVPYWIGRLYGMRALRIRWVARVLHPERFDRLRRRFAEHGDWTTFACRFLMGVRIPGYFVAGMLGMGYPRFLLLDLLGVALTVPASIWLGNLFGGQVDRLHKLMGNLHLVLAFAVVVVVSIAVGLHLRGSARARRRAALVEVTEPERDDVPPAPPAGADAPRDPPDPREHGTVGGSDRAGRHAHG